MVQEGSKVCVVKDDHTIADCTTIDHQMKWIVPSDAWCTDFRPYDEDTLQHVLDRKRDMLDKDITLEHGKLLYDLAFARAIRFDAKTVCENANRNRFVNKIQACAASHFANGVWSE